MQHLKTMSTTFKNNIFSIENQMVQWGEATSATLKHLDLLLQHPHEHLQHPSETRGTQTCNMHKNLPSAHRKLLWQRRMELQPAAGHPSTSSTPGVSRVAAHHSATGEPAVGHGGVACTHHPGPPFPRPRGDPPWPPVSSA
jgi:hypothetical protein